MSNKNIFCIIGAQKGASTTLFDYLCAFDGVVGVPGEVSCFDKKVYDFEQASSITNFLTSNSPNATACGLKRPTLLGEPDSIHLLKKHLPDAKIFIVLRDRISRAESAYWWYLKDTMVPSIRINDVFNVLLNNKLITGYPRAYELLTHSLYAPGISTAIELFGADNVMVLTPDKQGNWLDKAAEFLNLPMRPYVPVSSNPGIKGFQRCLFWSKTNHWVTIADDSGYITKKSYPGIFFVKAFRRLVLYFIPEVFDAKMDNLTDTTREELLNYFRNDELQVDELKQRFPQVFPRF